MGKLQQIADHTGSQALDIDTNKLLQEVKQSIVEQQASVKAAEYLHKLQVQEQIYGSNFEFKKAIEEAQTQLNSPNFSEVAASRTALRFITGILAPLDVKVNDAVSKVVFDTVGEVAVNAERVTNFGGIETIADSRQSLAGQDIKKLQEAVEAQQGLMMLKTQVHSAQFDLISNFVTRPDANLWWSFGNLVPTLQPNSNLETALATTQAIINCSPRSAKVVVQSDLAKLTGQLHADAFNHWQEKCKSLGVEDPSTLDPLNKRQVIADSVKNVLDAFSWHGSDFFNGNLPPRALVGNMICTLIGKGIMHFSIDSNQKLPGTGT